MSQIARLKECITDVKAAKKHICARQPQTENNQAEAKIQAVDFAIKNVLTTFEALARQVKTHVEDLKYDEIVRKKAGSSNFAKSVAKLSKKIK